MNKILPPHLFFACVVLATALHYLFPVLTLLERPWTFVGLLPLVGGVIMLVWGSGRFVKVGTNIHPLNDPNILVTDGPFRFTRNPMYVGFILALTGAWVLFGSLSPVVGPVLFAVTINYRFIPFEEARCEAIFGDDYLTYKSQVRRWL